MFYRHSARLTLSTIARCAVATLALAPAAFGQGAKAKKPATPAPNAQAAPQRSTTLERIRTTGTLKLAYRADAEPFSFHDGSGKPTGYSVDLCQSIAESVKTDLNLPALKIEWVPVTAENRFSVVQQGQADLLCGAATVTLDRRKEVDFSVPIFPGGAGVLVRSDAPRQLRNILEGKAQSYQPIWRAVALNVLREQSFATISGTTADDWLNKRGNELQVQFHAVPVANYSAGAEAVLTAKASAFFGERAALLDAAEHVSRGRLTVIDRQLTYEPLALVMARGEDDFRLLVDRSLSRFYASPAFPTTYGKWFGKPDDVAKNFFRWNALPE